MRMYRIVLSLAATIACLTSAQVPAFAEENRGTLAQQMACTPDVWRLCFGEIPDVTRITACLQQNSPQLSNGCRAVFESNASMPPEQPVPAAPSKGRVDRAKPYAQ